MADQEINPDQPIGNLAHRPMRWPFCWADRWREPVSSQLSKTVDEETSHLITQHLMAGL